MVNAPTAAAAAVCQHQAWPQGANHSSCRQPVPCVLKFAPRSRPVGAGAIHIRLPRCTAAMPSTRSVSSCSNNSRQSLKGSRSGQSCTSTSSPNHFAELLLKASRRLIETLATVSLLTHPLPALAGDIIQGTPRVSDGDTIQVGSPKPKFITSLHSSCLRCTGCTVVVVGAFSRSGLFADQRPENPTVWL